MKHNVLIITRNLPPLVGGMERLIWHVINELRSDYRVFVAGPTGCNSLLPTEVNVVELPLRPIVLFFLRAKILTSWLALRHRPCIIFAGSGLTAPFAWLAARLIGARCIVYLHGLDIKVYHPVYRLMWLPVFRRFDRVLVNSHFTRQLAIEENISKERIAILHPGVEVPSLKNAQESSNEFRSRHGLNDVPIMLYVGRITLRKGLLHFVNEILQVITLEVSGAILVVIGDEPINALLSVKNESETVKMALKKNGLESSVRWLGSCTDEELDAAYFAADVLVFPVQERKNDIEGFGMVALEAAAHGLPTVAFSVGGVSDAIVDGYTGKLVSPFDNTAFANAVIEYLNTKSSSIQVDTCRKFAESLQWTTFGKRLRKICQAVVSGEQ